MRVLLADDHPIMRAGVRLMLENEADIEIVGEADNGLKAVDMTKALHPDVVIMDISMPDLDGFEATRRIVQCCPGTRVLVLTMYDSEEHFFEILKAGAVGYVPKKAAPHRFDCRAALGARRRRLHLSHRGALAGQRFPTPLR